MWILTAHFGGCMPQNGVAFEKMASNFFNLMMQLIIITFLQ